jgi:hypothetical protein
VRMKTTSLAGLGCSLALSMASPWRYFVDTPVFLVPLRERAPGPFLRGHDRGGTSERAESLSLPGVAVSDRDTHTPGRMGSAPAVLTVLELSLISCESKKALKLGDYSVA